MFSELLMALGLSFGLASTGASIPPIWYTNPMPSKVSLCSSAVISQLDIQYNNGISHPFDIDFTQNQWNYSPYWTGDTLDFDGFFYVVASAEVTWSTEDTDYYQSFVLNKVRLYRFVGSYDTELRDFYPFPIAWQGYYLGSYAYVNGFDNVWRGVQISGLDAAAWSSTFIDNRSYVMGRFQPSSGSSFGYSIDSVSEFEEFRTNLESRIVTAWLAQDDAYSRGYDVGYDYGYHNGFRDGENVGYDEGISATGPSALAGSLFGSILAIPFDVLNGLNEFIIWGMPVISILITFLIVALIVAIIKRFV